MMAELWTDIMADSELDEGSALGLIVNGTAVALFRTAGEIFALRDRCTHGAAKLSDGFLEDMCIECPLHEGRFDLRTGKAVQLPATVAVEVFANRVVDGRIQVKLV
jgi:nitrite reductase/ring-hydroxylating ferredoxin subunit